MEVGQADHVETTPRISNGSGTLNRNIPAINNESQGAFMRPFEVHSELVEGRVRRIAICGELDHATAPQLAAALLPKFEGELVIVDLSECDFIDSTGLALIIGTWRKLADDDPQLALCGPSGQVEKILDITGTKDWISVFESLEEALTIPD